MNDYLKFQKVEGDPGTTELLVYGDIRKKDWFDQLVGDDETRTGAFDFKQKLDELETDCLRVRINSYGGEVAEGLAIYSNLEEWSRKGGKLETIVDGFACSAASVIFMAGEKRIVPKSGLLMIHNAWTIAMGDSNDMRKAADDIEKITQPSVEIYVAKTGLSEARVKEMMNVETWMTSNEALELGFATDVVSQNAKQSLEQHYVYKLVKQIKELQRDFKNNDVPLEISEWDKFYGR